MTDTRSPEDWNAINLVANRATDKCGFVTKEDVAMIAACGATRLTMLLIRCGGGRFLAPAQDVDHFITAIEKSGDDYVRDVSFPAK